MRPMVKGAYFSDGFDLLESKKKKRKKSRVFTKTNGGSFHTFRYPSENNQWDKWWKAYTFQRGLTFFKAKKKKKSRVFTKARGWWSEDNFHTFRDPSENNR